VLVGWVSGLSFLLVPTLDNLSLDLSLEGE